MRKTQVIGTALILLVGGTAFIFADRPTSEVESTGRLTSTELQNKALHERRLRFGPGLDVLPPAEVETGEVLPFIIGGNKAIPGQFPWMVFLTNDGSTHIRCSGALIQPNWVLTAAHCVNFVSINDDAYIGFVDADGDGDGGEIRNIHNIVIHSDPDENDIALLGLDSPSELPPLSIDSQFIDVSTDVTIIGFGDDGGSSSDSVLRYAGAESVPAAECEDIAFFSTKLCAGDTHAGICWGDSGGPLLRQVGNVWKLVGVANEISSSSVCGPNKHGLRTATFARGSDYVSWIDENTGT